MGTWDAHCTSGLFTESAGTKGNEYPVVFTVVKARMEYKVRLLSGLFSKKSFVFVFASNTTYIGCCSIIFILLKIGNLAQ